MEVTGEKQLSCVWIQSNRGCCERERTIWNAFQFGLSTGKDGEEQGWGIHETVSHLGGEALSGDKHLGSR